MQEVPPEIATLYNYLKALCEDLKVPFDSNAALESINAVRTKVIVDSCLDELLFNVVSDDRVIEDSSS
jgi:hypothetical protein